MAPTMLDKLTRETFTPLVSQTFRLATQGLDLTLIEASPVKSNYHPGGRPPFSLLFRGPREPALSQGTYELAHVAMGRINLFLVPVGPLNQGPDALCYEAVFN